MTKHISDEQITLQEPAVAVPSQQNEEAGMLQSPTENNMPKHKARVWLDVLVMLLIFLLSQGIGGVLATLFGVNYPDENMMQSFDSEMKEQVAFMQARFVAVAYFISMVICLSLLWLYKRVRKMPIVLEFRILGWASPFRLLCGYLLMWVFTIAIEPLTELLPGDQSNMGSGGWLLVSAVVLAPVFEEIFFRGYLAGIVRHAYGAVAAWFVSALLFAVVHGIPSVVVSALFCGLVLSFYYLRYRSLVMVILLHAMNNVTACFLTTLGLSDMTMHKLLGGGTLYWSIYGFCFVVAVLALIRMYKTLCLAKK